MWRNLIMSKKMVQNDSDIILNSCPVDCKDCHRVYISKYIPQKIACECKCHNLEK